MIDGLQVIPKGLAANGHPLQHHLGFGERQSVSLDRIGCVRDAGAKRLLKRTARFGREGLNVVNPLNALIESCAECTTTPTQPEGAAGRKMKREKGPRTIDRPVL